MEANGMGSVPNQNMLNVKAKLASEMADVEWCELSPHSLRDALIVVNSSLNLLDVGIALAQNEVETVQSWITQNLISKPTVENLKDWETQPHKKFSTLIVQPYVLVCAVQT